MFAIRNTKTLAECPLLKKESTTEKSLLERIRMEPTLSTKLYDRLIKVDLCYKGNWSGVTPEKSSHKLQSENISYTHL